MAFEEIEKLTKKVRYLKDQLIEKNAVNQQEMPKSDETMSSILFDDKLVVTGTKHVVPRLNLFVKKKKKLNKKNLLSNLASIVSTKEK